MNERIDWTAVLIVATIAIGIIALVWLVSAYELPACKFTGGATGTCSIPVSL